MTSAGPELSASVQLSAAPGVRARVQYTLAGVRFHAAIEGADEDVISGAWRTAVTHRLPLDAELSAAWQRRDPGALWARYVEADLHRWGPATDALAELMTEYDEPAVVFLRRYTWQQAVQPWTCRVTQLLAPLPQTYRRDADLFVAAVPLAVSEWLRTYWSLPQARSSMHLPGAANDSSETFTLALGLWSETGGPMPSLSQALTTARHATCDVRPTQG